MPEDDFTSTALPTPATETPALNDAARTENSLGENLREKIFAAVAPVAAKFGIVHKGRGRPKKDGSPKISDVVDTKPGVAPAALAAVATADSVAATFNSPGHQLFRRIVVKAFESEISILKAVVKVKCDAADLDEDFCEKSLTAATPEKKSFADVAESADYVAIKYGWNVDRMPEIALGLDLLHLHAPFGVLFMALNSEIKRKRAAEISAKNPQDKK
jgi:hypothetical protein